jgi:O-6-methylguanine DNA methyltransferase
VTLSQGQVYKIVKKIPKGQVLSYKEVAKRAGHPRAWRAVGNILNKNRDPKIPCYRVIRSDGQIGGYRKGIKKKIKILKSEHIKLCARPSTNRIFLRSGKKI